MDPFVRSPTKTTRASYTRIGKSRPAAATGSAVDPWKREILDGDQPPGTIGGESTARLIRKCAYGRKRARSRAARR